MYFIKRSLLLLLFILFIVSIYKDLSTGTFIDSKVLVNKQYNEQIATNHDFKVVKIKVNAGDTTFSIIEKINQKNLSKIDMTKILNDFKQINPQTEPSELENNTYYYFPIY